jgi:hypothetical protein
VLTGGSKVELPAEGCCTPYDVDLEKTYAHALCLQLIPGLILLWLNLVPLLHRSGNFRVDAGGTNSSFTARKV